MEYSQIGKDIYPGRIVELYTEENTPLVEQCSNRFRLLILEKGSFILSINDQQTLMEAPSFYCINSKDQVHMGAREEATYRVVYFSPAIINSKFDESVVFNRNYSQLTHTETQDLIWLNPFLCEDRNKDSFIKAGPSSLNKILHLYELMEAELDKQPDYFWPCRSRSFLLEILYALYSFQTRFEDLKTGLEWEDSQIDNILVYLHTHYHQNITLTSLVEKFNMNRTKINNLIQKATGQPVIAYLINLRIKLACFILRDTMRPVQEIAYLTGFNDISHFGRTFKKITNHNPSDYREKYTWM